MRSAYSPQSAQVSPRFDRSLLFKGGIFFIGLVFIGQLFITQIIKHDYYSAQALAEHAKLFEVPAKRGTISLSDGFGAIPIVLNETRFVVYADPKYIQNSEDSAIKLQSVLGGDREEIKQKLQRDSRYVILEKNIEKEQAERVKDLKVRGVALKEVSVRSYPQGSVAAHVLGFVNDEGKGQYGVESYLDESLKGSSGLQKVITDIKGVPLAINNDGPQQEPVSGDDVTLTLDIRLQSIVEQKLKEGAESTGAKGASAVLINPNNGQIKAMANYPTYDPSRFFEQKDLSVFTNTAITNAWEPGSVVKPLLMSAVFEEGALSRGSSFYDVGYKKVADRTITNSLNWGARYMSMDDIISKSLNTGAVYMLESLGDGDINDKARTTWYDYLVNRYMFNRATGVELASEQGGFIRSAEQASGVKVAYSNMAFGQGLTVTPLQLAAAYSALVNGGTYYKPTVISEIKKNKEDTITKQGPQVVSENIISQSVSNEIKDIMTKALASNNQPALRDGYRLGAKSGTAQIAGEDGRYKEDAWNGAYVGFIEGKRLEYVLLVRLDEPKSGGFASFHASRIWASISNELINTVAMEPIE